MIVELQRGGSLVKHSCHMHGNSLIRTFLNLNFKNLTSYVTIIIINYNIFDEGARFTRQKVSTSQGLGTFHLVKDPPDQKKYNLF